MCHNSHAALPLFLSSMSRSSKEDRKETMKKPIHAFNHDSQYKSSFAQFVNQLRPFGLVIRDVSPDGNCLFRSFADQLEGDQTNHDFYRQAVCDFLDSHVDDFKWFVDGDFGNYVKCMRNDATWGGNIELQALSLKFEVNIVVHQLNQPRLDILNFDYHKAKTVHLSYHNGQHYCSVRNENDGKGAAGPIQSSVMQPKIAPVKKFFDDETVVTKAERIIIEQTQCKNIEIVREALEANDNSLDATIEYLLHVQAAGDTNGWDKFRFSSTDNQDYEAPFELVETDKCACGSGKRAKKCCVISQIKSRGLEKYTPKLSNKERKEQGKNNKLDELGIGKKNITDKLGSLAI